MEELRIYLDLVDELGDPFTVFERGWDRDDDPAPQSPPQAVSAPEPTGWFDSHDYGFPG